MGKTTRALSCAAIALASCGKVPVTQAVPQSAPRTGTNVGVAAVFFADFAALAKAGKLTALTPLLVKAIANGTAADMLSAMQILADESKSQPYATALGSLLNADDQAPLSALLAENGPIHLLASDPSAPQTMAALAALSRTGVLRQVGYQAVDSAIQSPLTLSLLPGLAETLREGGPAAMTYAASMMALMQADSKGGTEPVGIAAVDLMLAFQAEGRIHPLLDPWTSALSDPTLAEGLRAAGAMVDDLRNSPADLAVWNSSLDALGATLGTGVLDQQLTSPDGTSPSPVQLTLDAELLGTVPLVPPVVVPGASANALQSQLQVINLNLLDAVQAMLGPGGGIGLQAMQALQAAQTSVNSPLPVDQLVAITQPYLTYPYCNGQPTTIGANCGPSVITADTPVGFVQLNHVVGDGLYAYLDTSAFASFIAAADNLSFGFASSLLSSTFQCGTIDANNPITALPQYPFSVSLQMMDDVNSVTVPGMSDDLASTERMEFLSCFFSRQGRLPTFLSNSTITGLLTTLNGPDLTPGDPNSTMNPSLQYVLANDAQGTAMLGAMYDPNFNLNLTDETALGSPETDPPGPLRVLVPAFRVLESTPMNDPNGVYTNLLRYFITLSSATIAPNYIGPDGQTHPIVGDLMTPILPLLQPMIGLPTPQTSAGNQLFALFFDKLQNLPVDGNNVQATLMASIAEALSRRSNTSLPPLWQPMVDAMTAHKDDMDRTSRALWPDGGTFVLDGVQGTPLPAVDTLISGGNGAVGLSGTFAGPSPRATAPAELSALLGTPLDQSFQVLADLRQVDPNSNVYFQNQRLLAEGAGTAISKSGAAALGVPGILDLTHLMLQIDLLPQTVDMVELIDQSQLTPGVLSLGDAMVQAGAAPEALDLVQLTLQDATP